MRVILETRTGPQAGRKIWLKQGQTVQVGSTEDADFAIPDDLDMAGVHFTLRTDHQGCHLTDLNTEAGTLVNGAKVSKAELNDGDQIQAGQTILLVRIDGGRLKDDNSAPAAGVRPAISPRTAAPVPRPAAAPAPPQQPTAAIACKEERCGSGLTMFESVAADSPPSLIVQYLSERLPAIAVADLTKLKLQFPPDAGEPCYVLDWLNAASKEEYSPVVLRHDQTSEFSELLDKAWGRDGLVCVFAQLDSDPILAQLRSAAAYNPSTGVQSEGETVLAYWWPSVFRLILTHSLPANVRQVLGEIDAVLLEGPEPGSWQLFGRPAFMDELRQAQWLACAEPPPVDEPAPADEVATDEAIENTE